MITIGITGTLGAGKGTIVDYLVQNKGFVHYSVRAFLTEEIKRRGLEVNRDTMTLVGNDLRAKHSPSWIVEQLYEKASASGCNCIIESVRTPGEVDALRGKFGSSIVQRGAVMKTGLNVARKFNGEADLKKEK